MAGMINLSLTQQLDEYGAPLSDGLLYIIQAGTVATPQNAYQDEALTIAMPNPIPLDAAGRIPQFFLADGQIKVRLQDANGIVKFVADNLLVIGPSATGGGDAGAVDPSTVLATGDLKARYDTAILTGWVRANGLTIGSTISSATELADDILAHALFLFLWNVDPNLAVSGGRGASASADWTANKQLTLPDWRGRCIAGMDTMGNSAAGRLTVINGSTLGGYGGTQQVTIAQANLPAITQTFTGNNSGQYFATSGSTGGIPVGTGSNAFPIFNLNTAVDPTPTGAISKINPGVQTSLVSLSPVMCATIYIKL